MTSLPEPLYTTHYGAAYVGDARDLLKGLPDESVDLVLTSPPFALQRQKEYGNVDQDAYVDWLLSFAIDIRRILKRRGSFVLDLGGAYCKGRPVRSLYNYRVLMRMCDELGWNLAEEFFTVVTGGIIPSSGPPRRSEPIFSATRCRCIRWSFHTQR